MSFDDLMTVALAFLVVTVSPGPANIAVSAVAMSGGRRRGLLFGAGLGVGLAVWGVVAATGMGAVLQSSAHALMVLKIVGGLYLLWLAVQSGRAAYRPARTASPGFDAGRSFRRGVILNLSNPKAVVAWMAALSMGLTAGDGVAAIATATSICVVIGFLNYAGYALVFSISGIMALYRKAGRWVEGVVAGLFAAAGCGLIRSAFSR